MHPPCNLPTVPSTAWQKIGSDLQIELAAVFLLKGLSIVMHCMVCA